MKSAVVVGGALVSWLAAAPAIAQAPAAPPNPLVGTWTLASVTREAIPSGEKTDLWGRNPRGYMVYLADGRMMVLIVRSDRKAASGPNATEAEHAALYRSMLAYTGRYVIEGDRLIHEVDVSWNESWSGSRQVRLFRIEGKRLTISTLPSTDPADGMLSTRTITWGKQD